MFFMRSCQTLKKTTHRKPEMLCPLTGAVTVNRILSKHIELSILCDDATATIVTSCIHSRLRLQFDHLLGLVWLRLPATFS